MAEFPEIHRDHISFLHTLNRTPVRGPSQKSFECTVNSTGIDASVCEYYKKEVPFTHDKANVDTYINGNGFEILRKYENHTLTEFPGSNRLTYFIDDEFNGGRQKPFILETLLTDLSTNQVPNAYVLELYDKNGTRIPPTEGMWTINPSEGLILFGEGYDPVTLGWDPVSIIVYVGIATSEMIYGGGESSYIEVEASEDIFAGAFVNLYEDSSELKVRKANCVSYNRICNGYIKESVSAGDYVKVYYSGINNILSGLTAGNYYYLGETPGKVTTPCVELNGYIAQYIGQAISEEEIEVDIREGIEFI